MEKAVLDRLNEHCDKYKLLPENQSAYRKQFSCETCVVKLVDDILRDFEVKQVSAMILVDLSAAFDTVNWDILPNVLHNQYGLGGTCLKWVDSYLRPRMCKANIRDVYSAPRMLKCSVPQGSCSGPWFYLTYDSTLFSVIHRNISLYGFADDHTARASFVPKNNEENEVISEISACAADINGWMNSNKLKMNNSKTEFILVGSQKQLKKCVTESIDIVGETVNRSACVRYLGSWIDEALSFDTHVSNKCATTF